MTDSKDTSAVMLDGAKARAYARADKDDGLQAMRALCRAHTPRAIERIAELLDHPDWRAVVAATRYLTEYGYGRPAPAPEEIDVVAEVASRPLVGVSLTHLLALSGASVEGVEDMTVGTPPRIEQLAPRLDIDAARRVYDSPDETLHDFTPRGNEVARVAASVDEMAAGVKRKR